jgi:hypothetical protein
MRYNSHHRATANSHLRSAPSPAIVQHFPPPNRPNEAQGSLPPTSHPRCTHLSSSDRHGHRQPLLSRRDSRPRNDIILVGLERLLTDLVGLELGFVQRGLVVALHGLGDEFGAGLGGSEDASDRGRGEGWSEQGGDGGGLGRRGKSEKRRTSGRARRWEKEKVSSAPNHRLGTDLRTHNRRITLQRSLHVCALPRLVEETDRVSASPMIMSVSGSEGNRERERTNRSPM